MLAPKKNREALF